MKRFKMQYLLVGLVVLAMGFFIACPIINTLTATAVTQDIWNLPTPSDTIKIEKISKAGKLAGNGNGMQFFGSILIKSDLAIDQLKEFYSAYSGNERTYVVEKQNQSEIQPIETRSLSFTSEVDSDSFYIVYSWGDGISPFCEFDLRGH